MAFDCCSNGFNYKKAIFGFCTLVILACVLYAHHLWGVYHRNIAVIPGQFANISTLKFVAVYFRHGDRAPTFKYKTDPFANAFPEGKGELTKKGKQHMYRKGQIIRNLYGYDFLSDMYLDSEILVKTTYMRRAYMSAAMVLTGMYPPKDYQKWMNSETVWQPIPIYGDSPDHGTLFSERGKCPSFDSITNKMLPQFFQSTDKNITVPLLEYLSDKCGQPITSTSIIRLYDLFVCQIANGLPLSEWIKPNHIEIMKSIIMKKENLDTFYRNPKLQKHTVGPLLKEIVLDMELRLNISNSNTMRKMHLYSGHDISIAMMMGYLGNIIDMPDFGASLHFHLYLDETIGYIIKLFYFNRWDNEIGQEFPIPICGDPCKIEDFIKLVMNIFYEKWEDECQKVEMLKL